MASTIEYTIVDALRRAECLPDGLSQRRVYEALGELILFTEIKGNYKQILEVWRAVARAGGMDGLIFSKVSQHLENLLRNESANGCSVGSAG